MEFLLDNPIAAMDGISFLVVYTLVVFFSVVTLGYFKTKLDESDRLGIPAIPPEIDPFEIAYLRGGPNELARMVVFSLRQKGAIVIANGPKIAFLRPAADSGRITLSEIERRALTWIGAEREVRETFNGDSPLVDSIADFIATYQNKLELRQMLTPSDFRSKLDRGKWTAFAVIGGLGAYKVLTSVATGSFNVLFTIILATVGLASVLIIGRDKRRTKLGDLYLERVKNAFSGLRLETISMAQHSAAVDGLDPLLVSAGVFGAAAAVGASYGDYNEAYRKQDTAHGSWGGAACGSCSTTSSCSGGSCGASGCGGGGCGGGGCGGGS